MSKKLDIAITVVLFILGMALELFAGYSVGGGIKFNDIFSIIFGIIILIFGIALHVVCWRVYCHYNRKEKL